MDTYDKFVEELAGRGLGVVADSGQSPGGLGSGDLLSLDQLLDQHDSWVATRLDEAVDEQSPAFFMENHVALLIPHTRFSPRNHARERLTRWRSPGS